ncbi:hypothetical protein V6N12_058340 [Hibiscus sabdariffa]|uniref:Uncharacterized protein n=1 Tax=Hibiscus sabdariffa TaxID=183260 RepID=A0ABR2ERU9_9ROSI
MNSRAVEIALPSASSLGLFGNGGGRPPDDVSGVGISSTEHRDLGAIQQGVAVNEKSNVIEISHVMEEDVTDLQGVGLGKESSGMEGIGMDELAATKSASQGKALYASVTARTTEIRDSSACNPRKEEVDVLEDDFFISQSGPFLVGGGAGC